MKLFETFKSLIRKVEEIDRKSKILSSQKYCASNPFAFKKDKTYVWIDKEENSSNSDINDV